jgi:hypothetical protein
MLDMGETAIDQDTFNEYLEEIKQYYTADKVSGHLRISRLLQKIHTLTTTSTTF